METDEIVRLLQACIYTPKMSGDKVSVASLKDAINKIAGKHIYCKTETRRTRL